MTASRIALALLLAAGTVLLVASGGDRPKPAPDPAADYFGYTAGTLRSHFPNVVLTTQDNRKVRFYDDVIRGNVVMIQFMFANCEEYCPMVTPNLVRVQRELKRRGAGEIKMISITVDPARDTPAVLKAYARKFSVGPGWQFLTGSKSDIDRIRRELGVWDPDEQKIEHMNVLTIGKEPTGQWIAIEGLAKTDDIVQTTLRFVPRLAESNGGATGSATQTNHPQPTRGRHIASK